MKRREPLVRYVSPFGTPAWMRREEAERFLAADDRRWLHLTDLERETGEPLLTAGQRAVGPPRIEHGGR